MSTGGSARPRESDGSAAGPCGQASRERFAADRPERRYPFSGGEKQHIAIARTVVLDKGRVAERGTHEALLELGGLYAALVARDVMELPSSQTDLLHPPAQS